MPSHDQPDQQRQRLDRALARRQQIADAAITALAHRRRNTDHLYAVLADLEGRLEDEHPDVVVTLLGEWAAHDAEQLAAHQAAAADCEHCARTRAAQDTSTTRSA